MEKRMLFLDLDGTLLNDAKEITSGNRQALELALARGHGVIITTGRPLKSALDQARKLGLDRPGCYLIAYNGAVVYDWASQTQIFARTLPLPTVEKVFAMVNGRGEHIQTYDTWEVLVESRCDDAAVRRYCQLIGMTFQCIGDVRTNLKEEPVKCLVINYDVKAGLLEVQDWIRTHMAEEVDCFFSCDQYLEVVPKGMSKGEAVKMLCKQLNIPIHNAVAVGDAANDLSMIEAAGIGVAMANGTEDVKAIANYITTLDNNHDGIAEVVDRFFGEAAE